MRAPLPLIVLALLCGCAKESARAEKEAAIVERTGDRDATCAAKRKVADAYLREGDEEGYRTTKLYADTACMTAQLAR